MLYALVGVIGVTITLITLSWCYVVGIHNVVGFWKDEDSGLFISWCVLMMLFSLPSLLFLPKAMVREWSLLISLVGG